MALSEYEQRLLEEMERRLYASEADSVQTTPRSKGMPSYRALVIGVLGAIAGVGLLIAGVATGQVWLGLIGFVVMLAGVLFIFDPKNRVANDGVRGERRSRGETLAERAERRWGERMDGER